MRAPPSPRDAHNRLRGLPSVQRLLESPQAAALIAAQSRGAVTEALRSVLGQIRARAEGPLPDPASILADAAALLEAGTRQTLRRAINATGIILHTNLGRAPLARQAQDAVMQVMQGYSNLEYDLDAGQRGARTQGIEPVLRQLTGAQAAVAVNNNAAAMLLALSALAASGEVIVSRGELVEIGGGFRIPDIIRQGGARLVEVGTTNKTRLADYQAAITADTRLLLKVHQSNFRIVGFTAAPALTELAGLARERGLLLMEDLGSGTLVDLRPFGRTHEPTVGDSLAGGADLVAFSGDKLLGGPQAGLLVGRSAAIDPMRKHPLMRAVRLDKMTLAALEATLRLYLNAGRAVATVPVLSMLAQDRAALHHRAERLCGVLAGLGGAHAQVVPSTGFAGGGALPDDAIPSYAVALTMPGLSGDELARRLRTGLPAVIARVAQGQLLLDMLTVSDAETLELATCVQHAAPSMVPNAPPGDTLQSNSDGLTQGTQPCPIP